MAGGRARAGWAIPGRQCTLARRTVLLGAVAIGLAGCVAMPGMESMGRPTAVAALEPTKGNTTRGTVSFTQKGDRVLVVARVTGLPRAGGHGFHIHEKGDCSSGDGMSAGGHFNPLGKPHAHHSTPERHAGDLPMLVADAKGNAELTAELDVIAVGAGPTDIVGKGLIVHQDPDDYKTQPTGNAGARLACAVVQRK